MDSSHFTVVAGFASEAAESADRTANVEYDSYGFAKSESLCRWQVRCRWMPAELVKSIYGWGLRYASGTQGFGIIRGARHYEGGYGLDGTLAAGLEAAVEWVFENRDSYVFIRRSGLTPDEQKLVDAVAAIGAEAVRS